MTAICCNVESSINEDDYELNRLHHPVTTTTVTLKVLARKITVVTENQSKNKLAQKSQFQFQSWSWIQRCLDLDWWRRILFVYGNEVDVGRDKLLCCVLRFKVKLLYAAEYFYLWIFSGIFSIDQQVYRKRFNDSSSSRCTYINVVINYYNLNFNAAITYNLIL